MLQIIEQNRELILLGELMAFFHDLDKLSSAFLNQAMKSKPKHSSYIHNSDKDRSGYLSTILGNDLAALLRDNLDGKLKFTNETFSKLKKNLKHPYELTTTIEISNGPISLSEGFIRHHGEYNHEKVNGTVYREVTPFAFILDSWLGGMDGIESDADKGDPTKSGEQERNHIYISTAFGYEPERFYLEPEEIDKKKDNFIEALSQVLTDFKTNKIDATQLRHKVLYELSPEYLRYAMGDTRRSANDVTLYDHSYSVASLFKSALVRILLEASQAEGEESYCLPFRKDMQFKILSIMVDGREVLSRGFRIGDILGYKKKLNDMKEKLKSCIENEWPIGNEIYRDEHGIHFVIPSLKNNTISSEIEKEIIKRVENVANKFDDFSPVIEISRETQLLTILNQERLKCLKQLAVPYWGTRRPLWVDYKIVPSPYPKDICPVCRVRLKEEYRDRCDPCQDRYQGRAQTWCEGIGKSDVSALTIWMGEIADENNRVALITGEFDLGDWLGGDNVSTLLIKGGEFKNLIKGGNKLLEHLNPLLDKSELGITGFKFIFDKALLLSPDKQCYLSDLLKERVQAEGISPEKKEGVSIKVTPEILAFAAAKKYPSAGRLRRVFKTAEEFWKDLLQNLGEDLSWIKDKRPLRQKRLKIHIRENTNTLKKHQAYEARWKDKRISLFWDGNAFVTIDNLTKLLDGEQRAVIDGPLRVLIDDGRVREEWEMPIENTEELTQKYLPLIEILSTPITFQVLCPASGAWEICRRIKERYEREMGKVRSRLSLNLGVIFFDQRFPLYVALDSSRRMMASLPQEKEEWEVIQVCPNEKEVELVFQTPRQREIRWTVNTMTGDPKVQDTWYPYLRLTAPCSGSKAEDRNLYFKGYISQKWQDYIHASCLRVGDKVEVSPSHFDFEYLDSSARRYDLTGNRVHRIMGSVGPRPYYLEEVRELKEFWDLCKKHLQGQASLKRIEELLVDRVISWGRLDRERDKEENGSVLKRFTEAVVRHPNHFGQAIKEGKLDEPKVSFLVRSCTRGFLFDAIELFCNMLGETIQPRPAHKSS